MRLPWGSEPIIRARTTTKGKEAELRTLLKSIQAYSTYSATIQADVSYVAVTGKKPQAFIGYSRL
jgi:hypothetical protein